MNEERAKWHQMSADAVCKKLHTDAAAGLSRRAARSRYKKEGANTLFDDRRGGVWQLFRPLLCDPAVLILLGGMLLALFFGAWGAALLLLLCGGACVGCLMALLLRYRRLLRIAEDCRIPHVTVLREGEVYRISARTVVRGDLLLLRCGDVVPCDCRILSATDAEVLTLLPDDAGRARYVRLPKNADMVYPYASPVLPPQYENMLFGGSEILSGEYRAVAVERSHHTYVGALQSMGVPAEPTGKRDALSLPKPLNAYLRLYGFGMLILFGVLSVLGIFLTPDTRTIMDTFFSVCVLTGGASPALIALFVRFLKIKGMTDLLRNEDSALLKSARACDVVNTLTDVVVIGHGASSDGILHFDGAMVGETVWSDDPDASKTLLHPLCEALCILQASRKTLPSDGSHVHESLDSVEEELALTSDFDRSALEIRLKGTNRIFENSHIVELSVRLSGREDTLLFCRDARLLSRCVLYEDGGTPRAVYPELRGRLRAFAAEAEQSSARILTVMRRYRDGTLSFVGILTMREHCPNGLGGIFEDLERGGVQTRVVLTGDPRRETAYARACRMPKPYLICDEQHPHLTRELLETHRVLIGFPVTELTPLLAEWKKRGRRAAVFTGDPDVRRCLPAAMLVAPWGEPLERPETERLQQRQADSFDTRSAVCVRRRAELLIRPADKNGGGLFGIAATVFRMRATVRQTEMLLRFLMVSQLCRTLLCALSLLFGLGVPTAATVFIIGVLAELSAGLYIAAQPVAARLLADRGGLDEKRITEIILDRGILISAGGGGLITTLYGAILTWTGVWSAAAANTYFVLSVLLLQTILLYTVMWQRCERRGFWRVCLPALVTLGASVLIVSVALLLGVLGAGTSMGIGFAVLVVSVPLLSVTCALVKFILSFFGRTAK